MGQLIKFNLSCLCPGRYRPRKNVSQTYVNEMAQSLRAVGQTDPIKVTESRSKPGLYEIVNGEYRWRAATQLGWETLDSVLVAGDDKSIAIGALTANSGLPLNPIEQAEAYARLNIEFGMSHLEIAKACGKGKNRSHVTKAIRMLQLPRMVRDWISEDKLTFTHAQILLEAPEEKVVALAEKSVQHGWDTRKLKQAVGHKLADRTGKTGGKDRKTIDWIELEDELTKTVGVPVTITSVGDESSKQFDVTLTCSSKAALERVLNCLKDGGVLADLNESEPWHGGSAGRDLEVQAAGS